jgi:hypothetical protein
MQWLQDPNQSNADNLNDVRRDASRHFRGGKKRNVYLSSLMMKVPDHVYVLG